MSGSTLSKLRPIWIAFTSLFYNGDVNCVIRMEDYSSGLAEPPHESFYNVYCMRLVKAHLAEHGYRRFAYTPFEIDIDLPKPTHGGRGTYTETLVDGRRLQISGPLLMPWYFIAAARE